MFLIALVTLSWLLNAASKSFEALDQAVWRSRAIVHLDYISSSPRAPFLCEFYDVEIDPVAIFFKAKNPTRAVLDLYECCLKSENHSDGNCTHTSIHPSFCQCFYYERYFPSVHSSHQEEIKQKHFLSGTTWLMNHYAWAKNPDHFLMKILEFKALMANQPYVNNIFYKALPLPEEIDNLVSQDYPLSILTDYEKFIMKIVETSLNRTIPYTSLNHQSRVHFLHHLTKIQKLHTSCIVLQSQKFDKHAVVGRETVFSEVMKVCEGKHHEKEKVFYLANVWHGEHIYLSPRYKNNAPDPVEVSMRTFQDSVHQVMQSLNHSWEGKTNEITAKPIIAVLQRTEGSGPRSILNLAEVGREIRKIFGIVELKIWFIAEDTSAIDQVTYFNSADIIIATHSSQLTNLVFSRSGTSVIEIQPEVGEEYSFRNIGLAVGLDYYMLNKGHQYDKSRDPKSKKENSSSSISSSWRLWDYHVNITMLSEALQTIKRKHHFG
eukprot:gene9240-10029_t